jgi:DNA recombination protein RmuC
MDLTAITPILAAGFVGALAAWLWQQQVHAQREREARERESALREAIARLEGEAAALGRQGNVGELLAPIRETLSRTDAALARLGTTQAQVAGQIGERLDAVLRGGEALVRETQQLSQALRAPTVRGQWGELQLRRVCELAGMLAYCDFEPQVTVRAGQSVQRPDLVVRLPGERRLVVDAKAPLSAWLEALNAPDERTRKARMAEHAQQVKSHVQQLAARRYWAQFEDAPDFVVLFLPGEAFFAAALDADPSLLESALEDKVLLATPTTLIALLKAAAYGWRQERVAADAQQVALLGRELHERLAAFDEQLGDVGRHVQRAAQAYNRAVASLDSRVRVSARRLGEHVGNETLEGPARVAEDVALPEDR